MKILTPEEERDHYNATIKGGLGGGGAGFAAGSAGVWLASQRYPAFRQLTLPFRAFLIVSSSTFAAIVSADAYSRRFERQRHPESQYTDEQSTLQQQAEARKPFAKRAQDWAQENKYPIVFGSWAASLGIALGLVGRNPYLTGAQKLVQARVYAQGLSLAVVVASLALEAKDRGQGTGRWETVKVLDPNDPTHKHVIEKKIHHERYSGEDQWQDMIAAEEDKMQERQQAVKQREAVDAKRAKKAHSHDGKKQKKSEDTDERRSSTDGDKTAAKTKTS